MGFQKLFA
jgi:ubiquitin carboxyl-terminal hydrolase 40